MEKILERFLRYVAVDTQSDPESDSQPSAAKELNLLKMLRDELLEMGVEATLDEWGYVMASIPSNCGKDVPAVGFIAHADTAPDASGADVKPQIIENYDGGEIPLKGVPGLSLKPGEFPEMEMYKGQTLITTDGTTLLGADDKAGIAEIMDAVQYIVEHPEFKHGDIKIGFTPDEEIGRGVVKFDVEKFGAKYAYTLDGGQIGELEYENFNAAGATIRIQGRNVHPGTAKGKMKNAILIGMELNALLPVDQRPEYTSGYEGFSHLLAMEGSCELASLRYIIRDHDMAKFTAKKQRFVEIAAALNEKYGAGTVELDLRDSYYNMKEKVAPYPYIIERAEAAMRACGVEPIHTPIRGGTDGARLSYEGLPCPNLCTGGENFHSRFEFVSVESMEKIVDVLVELMVSAAV